MKIQSLILSLLISAAPAQNLVALGNANTQAGISQAQVYVAGNWVGTRYDANSLSFPGPAIYLVGNNSVTDSLRPVHRTISIEGTKGHFSGPLVSGPRPNFAAYAGLTNTYGGLTGNTLDLSAPISVIINLVNDLNVFDVDASQFSGSKTLDFVGTGNVVFNVTGNLTSWDWTVNYDPNKILFNFENATIINIDGEFTGSILAPNAVLTQSDTITGSVVIKDFVTVGNPSLNYAALVAIPESGSVLLILGAAGLILFKRAK